MQLEKKLLKFYNAFIESAIKINKFQEKEHGLSECHN